MIAKIGVRDEREEPPPRSRLGDGDGDGVGETEGAGDAAAASAFTVPVAVTSSRTFVHATALASAYVGAPEDVAAPHTGASTISEAGGSSLTEWRVATASGVENPSRRRADSE